MLNKNWKAVLATLIPLAGTLTLVGNSPAVQEAWPGVSAWLLAVAVPVVSGVITWFKRNAETPQQIDKAIEKGEITLSDLEGMLRKWEQDRR